MRRKLSARIDDPRIEVSAGNAEALAHDAGRFSFVVSTLVLCSVRDLAASLAEMHRVLAPGGKLLFLEHVAAEPGSSRERWQRRLEPLWTRISGNCHLTRDTARAIDEAGFGIEHIERESMRKANPLVRATIRGTAVKLA
jgi:ubiquinone/menaquinone biosynthesis C-methylase UbiE